ncbi:inosamine-phosphate amidinotransferase 1 [Aquisphaera insulae]|uniref:inosamine-phosphate amidinotransferase 1 n=1 Tax=Aquisphaera insulae TaxID=2712864 RepID=UPI0013ECC140|nr:inosamine-phosphate amidinotransferase 1 [Aquisphaera insulae]
MSEAFGRVRSYTEWDPLEEVVVGRAVHARIARPDRGLFAVEYRSYGSIDRIPSGPYPDHVIAETEEDLEILIETFLKLGVVVRRPDVWDHARTYRSPDFETDGQYSYCPRDLFVVAGDWLIEAPMTLRCRQYETLPFKPLLMDYLRGGARWVSAPRPRLADDTYCLDGSHPHALTEAEPIFDAANLLRLGRDILYLVSVSGNRLGAHWLQSILGPDFRVRVYDGIYGGTHVDTTITPVRPGLVVVNGERVGPHNLPDVFHGWDVVYLKDVVDIGFTGTSYASKWIGINFLMVRPELAIVDPVQKSLVKELERRGIEIVPLRLRHARTLGGGFHCVTLDVRRKGGPETYCRPAGSPQ